MSFKRILDLLSNRFQRKSKRQFSKSRDLVLGLVMDRGVLYPPLVFPEAARPQHLGIVGLSGSGKTYLIERMVRHDIENNNGVVVFDVHGDLSDSIITYLAEIAPFRPEVYERTVIIEPFNKERSFGFNPLEISRHTSAHLQAKEFTSILRSRLQGEFLSSRTAELLHHSLYTLSASNETLLRLPELLTKKSFRNLLVNRLSPGQIKNYWIERYDTLSPSMRAAFLEPVVTRISSFLIDPLIRDIIGQKKSTFSFRGATQNGHWVIINLSKGRLGKENSALLGSMLFTKLELDVMSLANVPEKDRRLFSVYADELQNLAGETFGRLIAEARKYKISLVAGHQFWRQLDPSLRHAMRAVGSKVFFRVHHQDATQLAGELTTNFDKNRYVQNLTVLGRGEAIVRIGSSKPVAIAIPAHRSAKPTKQQLEELKIQSAIRYAILRSGIRHS